MLIPTQLYQELMSLLINTLGAIRRGVIFVEAHNVRNDETDARMALDAKVDRYVRILIRDTCKGIPARVIDRVS